MSNELRAAVTAWLAYFDTQSHGLAISDDERALVERVRAALGTLDAFHLPSAVHPDRMTADEWKAAYMAAMEVCQKKLDEALEPNALRAVYARYIEYHGEPDQWDEGAWCQKHAPTMYEVRAALAATSEPEALDVESVTLQNRIATVRESHLEAS